MTEPSRKPLRTLCLTCGGRGEVRIPRAFVDLKTGLGRTEFEDRPCWTCQGDGWLIQAWRAS